MNFKARLPLIFVAFLLPTGLGLWARAATSWRPQKIGHYSDCFFVDHGKAGPWLRITYNRALQLDDNRRAIYLGGFQEGELHFAPDGRSYAVSAPEGNERTGYTPCIEWHKSSSGKLLRRFRKFLGTQSPENFKFSLGGTSLIIPTLYGVENLPLDGSKEKFFRLPIASDSSWVSPDGKWMCRVSPYPRAPKPSTPFYLVHIYNVQTGRFYQTIKDGRTVTMDAAFSPDSSLLWIDDSEGEGEDSGTWLCDAKSGRKLWDCPAPRLDFIFSPDSKSVLLCASNASAFALQVRVSRTGKLLRSLKFPRPIREAIFSGDSSAVYAIDDEDTVWKVRVR